MTEDKKMNSIFIHRIFDTIASSILSVFVPIIIINYTGKIWLAILFLILSYSLAILIMSIFRKFIKKYPVLCIILHVIPLFVIQILLSFCELNLLIILILGVMNALQYAFYWTPLNTIFSYSSKSADVARFQMGELLGSIIFTLASGFILSSNWDSSLLIVCLSAFVFYFLSIIPLLINYKEIKKFTSKDIDFKVKDLLKTNKKYFIFYLFSGFNNHIFGTIIPIYLFINNLEFCSIAIILASTYVLSIFTNYIAKYLCCKRKAMLSVLIGTILTVLSYVVLFTVHIPVVLWICGTLVGIIFPFIDVPTFSKFIITIKKQKSVSSSMNLCVIFDSALKPFALSTFFLFASFPLLFGIGCASAVTALFISKTFLVKNKSHFKK